MISENLGRREWHSRVAIGVVLSALLLSEASVFACDSPAAKALAADAKRATLWNWGWGVTLGASALAFGGLYHYSDDENQRLAFGITVIKSGLGSLNQVVFPIRIEASDQGCTDLDGKLKKARTTERKRHNWFAHSTGIVLNIAGSAYIGFATDDWLLATRTSVLGIVTGQLMIYTSPNKVREGGFGLSDLTLAPMIGSDRTGLILGGVF